MNESEFWVNVWKIAAVTVCVITTVSLGSCQSSKYQIRKAIEAGATPMEAACAFDQGNSHDGSICTIIAMGSKK
jgi:amino acid permease